MNYLGIDPDVHDCAFAIVPEFGDPELLVVSSEKFVRGSGSTPPAVRMLQDLARELPEWTVNAQPQVIVVESQRVYLRHHGGKADPDDLIRLAHVAGACAIACASLWPQAEIRMPYPAEWKGQVPKDVQQGRTFAQLGLESEIMGGKSKYRVPTKTPAWQGAGALRKSQWKHVGDALGLALWAQQCDQDAQRIATFRRPMRSR